MLLPEVTAVYGGRPMVIILDNNSVHINQQVIEAVQRASHLIHFLPPYSPDFNPIELTFSVLKSWIKRYYHFLRPTYSNFGEFLRAAIRYSNCNQFVKAQFRHSAYGCYIEQKELDRVREQLAAFKRGELDIEGMEEPNNKGLDKGLDKGLNKGLNEGLGEGLNEGLDKGLSKEFSG